MPDPEVMSMQILSLQQRFDQLVEKMDKLSRAYPYEYRVANRFGWDGPETWRVVRSHPIFPTEQSQMFPSEECAKLAMKSLHILTWEAMPSGYMGVQGIGR